MCQRKTLLWPPALNLGKYSKTADIGSNPYCICPDPNRTSRAPDPSSRGFVQYGRHYLVSKIKILILLDQWNKVTLWFGLYIVGLLLGYVKRVRTLYCSLLETFFFLHSFHQICSEEFKTIVYFMLTAQLLSSYCKIFF